MTPADKPVDVGTGVVCASFGRDGSWLSVGCLHPDWGFLELNGLPPFDETGRGDPEATRRYRASMTDTRFSWLRLEPLAAGDATELDVSTSDPDAIAWNAVGGDGRPSAVAFGQPGTRIVTQRWRLDGSGWVLRVAAPRLDRPPLAEITEVNPPAPTAALTELRSEGRRLVISAPALPAVATVDVTAGRWTSVDGGAELQVAPGTGSVDISVILGPGTDPPAAPSPVPPRARRPGNPDVGATGSMDAIVARALAYVRSCTALACAPDERAILTDHRLLPLSWTRDAYYQVLLLLAGGATADRDVVADHLRWLWRRCERPGGRWMRSHHGDGRPKDLAFQADQQLYPFVELADLWRAGGALPDGVDWASVVPDAWGNVLATIEPSTGLIGTEENSADDQVDAPFIAGSQVLLWYCARRLAEPALAARIGLAVDELEAVAVAVHASFEQHLVTDGRWAYAVDGRGGSVEYHDANEMPTVLAPLWGFCPADDPAWRGTIEFAFSPANHGFIGGADGGLGSAHTPGVWPLGHIQAWLAGRITGDGAMAAAALDRLQRAAFADGMLPEALAGGGAGVPIRHWFAWPGAALGAFWLLDQRGAWDVLADR